MQPISRLVVHADNLRRPRQPLDPSIDLVQFVELILREHIVSTRQEIDAGHVRRQRHRAREKPFDLKRIILHIKNDRRTLRKPIDLLVFLAPDLENLGTRPRVVLGRLLVVLALGLDHRHRLGNRLAKPRLQLLSRHMHPTRDPTHLPPCPGRRPEEVLVMHIVELGFFLDNPLDHLRGLDLHARHRVDHGRNLDFFRLDLVAHPALAHANDQPILNPLPDRAVPTGYLFLKILVQQPLQHRARNTRLIVLRVLPSTANVRFRRTRIQHRQQNLDRRPEQVDPALVLFPRIAPVKVPLDDLSRIAVKRLNFLLSRRNLRAPPLRHSCRGRRKIGRFLNPGGRFHQPTLVVCFGPVSQMSSSEKA